jgi:hypothetical protein
VYDNVRYDILKVEEFEQKTAWMIQAKRIDGQVPARQDHYAKANGYLLDLTQSVTATIE